MKEFIIKNKYKCIFVVIILLIIFSIYFITGISNKKEQNEYTVNDISNSLYKVDEHILGECKDLIDQNHDGKWVYQGGDFEKIPYVLLREDNTFAMYGWGGDGKKDMGSWRYDSDRKSIRFEFDKLNSYWKQTLQDKKLLNKFNTVGYENSILTYSLKNKYIEFSIGYYENPEYFKECRIEHFIMNFFNVVLYKEGLN